MHQTPENPSRPVEALIQRHGRFVERLAAALASDPAAAEDLVGETWLEALRSLPDRIHDERSWLSTVVRRRAMAFWKSRTRGKAPRGEDRVRLDEEDPARLCESTEIEGLLAQAVDRLAEPYRSTLSLRYREELSPTEIAARTELSVKTIKTRLSRGLALLRQDLERGRPGAVEGDGKSRWLAALTPMARLRRAVGGRSGGLLMATAVSTVIPLVAYSCWGGVRPAGMQPPVVSLAAAGELAPVEEPPVKLAQLEAEPSTGSSVESRASRRPAARAQESRIRFVCTNELGVSLSRASLWVSPAARRFFEPVNPELKANRRGALDAILGQEPDRDIAFQMLLQVHRLGEPGDKLIGAATKDGVIEVISWPRGVPIPVLVRDFDCQTQEVVIPALPDDPGMLVMSVPVRLKSSKRLSTR